MKKLSDMLICYTICVSGPKCGHPAIFIDGRVIVDPTLDAIAFTDKLKKLQKV